jgi:hypothetical protein
LTHLGITSHHIISQHQPSFSQPPASHYPSDRPSHRSPPSPSLSPSPPSCICWFSTMLYTLALSSVNTRLVLRSSPRRPSRIAALGASLSSASSVDICKTCECWRWMRRVEWSGVQYNGGGKGIRGIRGREGGEPKAGQDGTGQDRAGHNARRLDSLAVARTRRVPPAPAARASPMCLSRGSSSGAGHFPTPWYSCFALWW